MSQDIDKITTPEGAKDAFKLVMAEFYKVASPHPGFRSGTFFAVGLAIQRLPTPPGKEDIFKSWRSDAQTSLSIWESAKTKPKFKEAKKDFLDKLRGILDTYLHES
jgi:hypothetical protein